MAKLDPDTLEALIEYLIAHGYPKSSMAIEWPIGNYRADLAVVDPDTKEPVAIFELKHQWTPQNEKLGKAQLESFLKALGKTSVPAYLVFKSEGTPPFEIQKIVLEDEKIKYTSNIFSSYSPPDFTTLTISGKIKKIAKTREELNRIVDVYFYIVCGICAFAVILLLYGELSNKISISVSGLTLIGAAIALILLPFASKIKFLGLEFEKLIKEK